MGIITQVSLVDVGSDGIFFFFVFFIICVVVSIACRELVGRVG